MLADDLRRLATDLDLGALDTREGQAAFRGARRSAARVLSDAGRTSARRAVRGHGLHGRGLPVRRRVEASSRQRIGDCAGRG